VTRRETAVALATAYPSTPVIEAATTADTGVFGPGEPSDSQIDAFWTEVETIVAGMTGSRSWWQRLRALLSLRSFLARRADRRAARQQARATRRTVHQEEKRMARQSGAIPRRFGDSSRKDADD
jgi:hypothetical protein